MSHSKEDDLKLGSITEVWTSREQWLKYCQYLDNMAAEAYDSEGVPIKLSRYALFLKVCNCIYQERFVPCSQDSSINSETTNFQNWLLDSVNKNLERTEGYIE